MPKRPRITVPRNGLLRLGNQRFEGFVHLSPEERGRVLLMMEMECQRDHEIRSRQTAIIERGVQAVQELGALMISGATYDKDKLRDVLNQVFE